MERRKREKESKQNKSNQIKRKDNDKVKKEVKEGLEERLTVIGIGGNLRKPERWC